MRTKEKNPGRAFGNKRRACNALKEGFFAKKLVISDQDTPEFDELRKILLTELQPETPLEHVAFSNVVYCCWRCSRLAPRLEARMLAPLLRESAEDVSVELPSNGNPIMHRWFGANRQALKEGQKFLIRLLEDVRSSGTVREEWKDPLIQGFGSDFFEELTKWKPLNYQAALLADYLSEHAKTFRHPLPKIDQIENKASKEVILDPFQQKQMMEKLILQQIGFLGTIRALYDQKGVGPSEGQNTSPIEAASRYSTSTMRNMHCAIKFYRELKA